MQIITEKLTLSPGASVILEGNAIITAESQATLTIASGADIEILGTLKASGAAALIIPTYADSGDLPTPAAAIYGAIGYLIDQATLCVCTASGWKVLALADHTHA